MPRAVIDRPGRTTLHRLQHQQGSSSLFPLTPVNLAVWDDEDSPLEVEATSLDTFFGSDEDGADGRLVAEHLAALAAGGTWLRDITTY